jgi:prevent-host-death family protein
MPLVVNMNEAKRNLSKLVKRAAAGEEITIANHGKPVALLTRLPAKSKKIPWMTKECRLAPHEPWTGRGLAGGQYRQRVVKHQVRKPFSKFQSPVAR